MNVLITGAEGFIAKNLMVHLRQRGDVSITSYTRRDSQADLVTKVEQADFIFHMAGVNRPLDTAEFEEGNANLTRALCDAVVMCGRPVPVIFSSSIQAVRDNPYGASKRAAEESLQALSERCGSPVYIYRLPNVFGKWCRPNYNSAVATFCHNIAQGLPIQVNQPDAVLDLVYVDDVVSAFLRVMDARPIVTGFALVAPVYSTTVGQLADQLHAFRDSRASMVIQDVGAGLTRALYSTYISYFTPEQFAYPLVRYADPRGVFVEMLKTKSAGQFSFFTAYPGITRGGHYHHTKTEKFLVIKGRARFGFRHIDTDATYALHTNADEPMVVETIPGWSHDITNVGEDEMIVMLWANEIFDRERPDTINYKV